MSNLSDRHCRKCNAPEYACVCEDGDFEQSTYSQGMQNELDRQQSHSTICPLCRGLGETPLHLRIDLGGRFDIRDCWFCSGIGAVQESKAIKWYHGEMLRKDRQARHMTLRDEAKRLGISPKKLEDLEWGRS